MNRAQREIQKELLRMRASTQRIEVVEELNIMKESLKPSGWWQYLRHGMGSSESSGRRGRWGAHLMHSVSEKGYWLANLFRRYPVISSLFSMFLARKTGKKRSRLARLSSLVVAGLTAWAAYKGRKQTY